MPNDATLEAGSKASFPETEGRAQPAERDRAARRGGRDETPLFQITGLCPPLTAGRGAKLRTIRTAGRAHLPQSKALTENQCLSPRAA